MKTKTELILASKAVNVVGKGERVILTTESGAQVWVKADQYNTNHDTVTYNALKANDKVIAHSDGANHKKGDTIVLKQDQNEFLGSGKQMSKLESFKSKMLVFQELGIVPTLAM